MPAKKTIENGLMIKHILDHKVILLFLTSLLVYLSVDTNLPDALVDTWLGNALIWPDKTIDLIKNVSLSTIASCVFYFFIVYIPEQKQKTSLRKIIEAKVNLIYDQAVGVAWVLVSTHHMRGAGTPFNMGEAFIKEWCKKTDVTHQDHEQVPNIMHDHWLVAKNSSKELSDILTRNMAIVDHGLLEHLQEIENTNLDLLLKLRLHPQALEGAEAKIIDLYKKSGALREYYESEGGVIENT